MATLMPGIPMALKKLVPALKKKFMNILTHSGLQPSGIMIMPSVNVYAGLAGMYIIRDDEERSLNLPSGRYEIPLVIQDRSFNEDGSLFYPRNVDNPGPDFPDPSVTPGVAGDKILVNGMAISGGRAEEIPF